MKISDWMQAIHHCQTTKTAFVLATVVEHSGSVPRDAGAKMVITQDATFDTIGGGNLEFLVTRTAQEMLNESSSSIRTEHYPLAAKTGQCCGGFATVLLESHQINTQHVAVFGAGHVAKELVPILQRLPVAVHWIDEREALFPDTVQSNVNVVATDCPVTELQQLPANTLILIMTHNHQLDFELVKKAITRADIHFVGMIGSRTKAKRFQYRLRQRELTEAQIAKMISPVGELSIPGKTPIEVAVSMSAQIIQLLHQQNKKSEPEKQVSAKIEETLGS